MRILILGGSGFLGSHVVDRFLAGQHDVAVYDLATERFRRTPDGVTHFSGDLRNVAALEEALATGFDAVLHFISTTTPRSSNESPEFDIQSNVVGTVNLLNVCVRHGVKKFIFLSSGGTVYGDIGNDANADENHPVQPLCSYGVSKLSIEHYLRIYQKIHGLDFVSLRISNPYGERQNPLIALGALTVFLYRTMTRQTIEIWGDGSVVRDFVYAGDVAHAVYEATLQPVIGVYNVGSGLGMSLNDLLVEIAEATGLEPRVKHLEARPYDVPRIVLDSSKLRIDTGWSCAVPLRQGITRTAHWLQHRSLLDGKTPELAARLARKRHTAQ
jgi:UDP-glucose 4-epimerase